MTRLRELNLDDAPDVRRIFSGRSLKFLGRGPMSSAEATAYVSAAMARSADEPRLQYTFGIEVKGDTAGIVKVKITHDEGRLSYILRHDAWGRGYAASAVTEMLTFAFDALSLSTVRAKHQVENRASGRVLVKTGFTRIGTADGFSHYAQRMSVGCIREGRSPQDGC